MTLLLSLLGEQPIPNLLPLWQYPQFTRTRFAATETTMAKALALKQAIHQDPQLQHVEVLEPLLVEAYDIRSTRAALAKALAEYQQAGQPVCLNLTGGTKLMSLAALQAAFGSSIPLLYITAEKNEMIHLASDGAEVRRELIQVKITAAQYLRAHGLEVSNHPNFDPRKEAYFSQPPLEGNFLEEQVFKKAQESGLFDDVRRNIFIRKQTKRGMVKNELDVVVTHNGKLAVCSCKTGKSVTRESIYELASLSRREAFGIYCGMALVTDQEEIAVAIRDRAQSMNVHLVYGKELENVASHLHLAIR
jgi:hypothetical protein